jgi:hypothetical protein
MESEKPGLLADTKVGDPQGEAGKSVIPIAATYLLGSMTLFSKSMYSEDWHHGIEMELWEYFSQSIDPALIDPMGREDYDAICVAAHQADGWWAKDGNGAFPRFYPRQEWLDRVGGDWPYAENIESTTSANE